jgi:hypothetical protein
MMDYYFNVDIRSTWNIIKKKSGFIKCVTFSNRFNQLFNPKKEEEDNIKY